MPARLTLRQKIEYLNVRLEYMRAELARSEKEFPGEWRLCRAHARILRALVDRDAVSHQTLIDAQYWDKAVEPDCARETLFTQMMYLRRKLRPFGIAILTIRGFGYRLDPKARAALRVGRYGEFPQIVRRDRNRPDRTGVHAAADIAHNPPRVARYRVR
jgi:DNA-binding winged helix-turn-helix (wHTH) protein